jgi:signal transduction histidine kinase
MTSTTVPDLPGGVGRQSIGRGAILFGAAATGALLWKLGSLDFVNRNPLFHPHGYCYLWQGDLVASHVISDSLIALSYLTISVTLIYLVRRAQHTIPFQWMFLAFGLFIVACGLTHAMEIVTLWQPLFWLSADVKIVTALASVSTAIALPPLVPRILGVVRSATLSEERRVALERANAELEQRVEERTRQLSEAMAREHAMRERAEDANRLKDEFLSTISHELRTPLLAILGWSEMLSKGQLPAPAVDRAVASIQRNARAQTQLVDDLLDVSRMATGQLRLDRRPLAFDEVVSAALDGIRPVAEARQIALETNGRWSPHYVVGDEQRLQQVVWNLFTNAVKFTPDGGRVVVSMSRTPKTIRLEVADTGIGLDPSFKQHLFERFRQADSSPSRRQGGLGLGLALARELTELHGGHISAHSDGLGRGSTFVVELPATRLSAAGAHAGERRTARLDGARILVVDDDQDGLEVVAAALRDVGATVIPSLSVRDAVRHVSEGSIDLIVSDLAMPQEDGYAFIRHVRIDLGSAVPAIALTARVRQEDRQRALASGYQLHVRKPVLPSDLVQAVSQLIAHPASPGF